MISFKKKSRIGNIRLRGEDDDTDDTDGPAATGDENEAEYTIDGNHDADLKDAIRLEQQLRKRKVGVALDAKGFVEKTTAPATRKDIDATLNDDITSSLPAPMQKHQNIMESYINSKLNISITGSSSNDQTKGGTSKSLLEMASESLYKLPNNLRVESSRSGNDINGRDVVATDGSAEAEGPTSIVAGLVEVELPSHFRRENVNSTLKAMEGMSAHQLKSNAARNDWKVMQKYRNMVQKKH